MSETATETKPGAPATDQAAVAPATKPEGAAAEGAAQPSPETAATVSRAEFEQLRQQNEAILRGMNDAQRRAAQAESERDIYQRQAQAAAGVVPERLDPEAEAWKEFQETLSADSLKKYQQIHDENLLGRAQRSFTAQQSALQALPRAQEILGEGNPDRAAAILAEELRRPKTLDEAAILRKYRDGKLAEWAAEDQKAKEWRAKQAALTGPMGMAGNGRTVPGMNGVPPKRVVIPWAEWSAAGDAAKAEVRKDFNNPNVEYAFSDVPEGLKGRFDPTRD